MPVAPPPPALSPRVQTLCHALYLVALAVGVLAGTYWCLRHIPHVEEFAQACDSFGYLKMAQDIRTPQPGVPAFTIDDPRTHELVAYFRSTGLPTDQWANLVATQAHHYAPSSSRIICQYPPGVPLLLAIFPQGAALHTLYYLLLGTLLAAAAIFGVHAARTRRIIAPGLFAMATVLAIMLIGTTVSYSVETVTVPVMLALACLYVAETRAQSRWAWLLVLLAGVLAGYAILIRVTAALFVPGLAILVWPRGWRDALRRLLPLSVGVLAAGVVPLLVHQIRLTASLFVPTYAGGDAAPPALSVLPLNAYHYFVGDGAAANWALLTAAFALVAMLGFMLLQKIALPPRCRRWLAATLVLFAVPTLYFLTHAIRTPYYQLPTIAATLFAVAFTALTLPPLALPANRPPLPSLLLLLAVLPGPVAIGAAIVPPSIGYTSQMQEHDLTLPPPLQDPKAWIFADRFAGTLWYYHKIHAHQITMGTPESRLALYRFAFQRGEPQYQIYDNPAMKPLLQEVQSLGGRFEKVGTFDGQPVGRILWPATGPAPR